MLLCAMLLLLLPWRSSQSRLLLLLLRLLGGQVRSKWRGGAAKGRSGCWSAVDGSERGRGAAGARRGGDPADVDLDVGDVASPEKWKEKPVNGDPDVGAQGCAEGPGGGRLICWWCVELLPLDWGGSAGCGREGGRVLGCSG